MRNLTPIQRYLLEIIQQHSKEGRPAPTYRELCQQFGWTSTATARDHLKALEKKGYIHLSGGRARSVEIVNSACKLLLEFSPSPLRDNCDTGGFHILKNDRQLFAVRVSDCCLQAVGVEKGDLAIIDTERDCREGNIILIEFNSDQVFRRFRMRLGQATLYNLLTHKTEDFTAGQVNVIGVVIGFIKYMNAESINNEIE
ncbi:MAG: S24 family peptidase [bacterium]